MVLISVLEWFPAKLGCQTMEIGQNGIEGETSTGIVDTNILGWIVGEWGLMGNLRNGVFRNCGPIEGCLAKLGDLTLSSFGVIVARLVFRFPSFCHIDYRKLDLEIDKFDSLFAVIQKNWMIVAFIWALQILAEQWKLEKWGTEFN